MAEPVPETGSAGQAKSWLNVLMPLLEKGTPISLLLLLVLGGATLYYMNAEIVRVQANNKAFYEALIVEKERRIELALRVGACEGRHTQREQEPEGWPALPRHWPVPAQHDVSPPSSP